MIQRVLIFSLLVSSVFAKLDENRVLSLELGDNGSFSSDSEGKSIVNSELEKDNELSSNMEEKNVLSSFKDQETLLSSEMEKEGVFNSNFEEEKTLSLDMYKSILSSETEEEANSKSKMNGENVVKSEKSERTLETDDSESMYSERIIGGADVTEGTAPFMVYLKAYDNEDELVNTCGGVILNTTIILTSARCLYGSSWLECYAGSVDRTTYTQMVRGVGVWHAEYGKNSRENDIGIVRLQKALKEGPKIKTINLPNRKYKLGKDKFVGKNISLFGWGYSQQDGIENSQTLKRTNMIVIKNDVCKKKMKNVYYLLASTSFCTDSNIENNNGICEHDLGGAAIYFDLKEKPPTYYLIGIISESFDCPSKDPNVFTALYPFLDWIATMGGPKVK